MKIIILAGGYGTRLSEYTDVMPKPMISVNNKPIIERIMNIFSFYDYNEFYVALGYKSEIIKKHFFDNYKVTDKNKTYFLGNNKINLNLIDTGKDTLTGGRILRLRKFIGNETFMLTYGDGVSDINISDLVKFHKSHGKLVTVSAVRPPARFGALKLDGDEVKSFKEKNQINEGWINGGFFVIEPNFFNYLENDYTILEREPLETCAKQGELRAYKHKGFWQCMDTKRDRDILEKNSIYGDEPWKR